MLAAQNLMIRFFLETCGAPARIERHPALAEA
jgi:xanthine dehydrogenase small subunit